MFLMYVDESGDPGLQGSPTRLFVLTGLVVHELRWQQYPAQLVEFRRRMKGIYDLKLREEIHAAHFISKPGDMQRLARHKRLAIIPAFAKEIGSLSEICAINVVVDKTNKTHGYDVFAQAWQALIQGFQNTMSWRNFPGPQNTQDRGMLFPDHSDDRKPKVLLRRMRRYNPIPNQQQFGGGYRNLPLNRVV